MKAIVFDLLGTLVGGYPKDEYSAMLGAIGSDLGAEPEAFVSLWRETYEERTTGRFSSTRSTIEWMCDRLGLAPAVASVERAVVRRLDFTIQALVPYDGIIRLLARIKARRLKLGLISDCSADIPDVWSGTVMASYFDVTTFSCVAGIRKPAPEIYTSTCAQLGVEPSACIYVGDGGNGELTGARAVGMHPVKVTFEPEAGIFRMGRDDEFGGPSVRSVSSLAKFVLERCDHP